MDCKTARMMLEFSGPEAGELDQDAAAELEGHLADCLDCQDLAHHERRIDKHLGQAMHRSRFPTVSAACCCPGWPRTAPPGAAAGCAGS